MKYNTSVLGLRIREERISRKLTIEKLAEILNISTSFLGLVERGYRSLSIDKVCRIAEIFDVSLDSLFAEFDSNETSRSEIMKTFIYNLSDDEFDFAINMLKLINQQHIQKK